MIKNSILLFLILVVKISNAQKFDLTSNKFEVGAIYISNPKIYFDIAQHTIRKESFAHLDSIATFLLRHDSLIIEIGIHTDSRMNDSYSLRLDKKRAEGIMEYLIKKGVASERLSAQGYGKTEWIISDEK